MILCLKDESLKAKNKPQKKTDTIWFDIANEIKVPQCLCVAWINSESRFKRNEIDPFLKSFVTADEVLGTFD